MPLRDLFRRRGVERDPHLIRRDGRADLAAQLTTELTQMRANIQDNWTLERIDSAASPEVVATYYLGQIDAYNRIATALQRLDDNGYLDADMVPELIHPEGMAKLVERAAEHAKEDRLERTVSAVASREYQAEAEP